VSNDRVSEIDFDHFDHDHFDHTLYKKCGKNLVVKKFITNFATEL
jgi:hypothetical protein